MLQAQALEGDAALAQALGHGVGQARLASLREYVQARFAIASTGLTASPQPR